jgi:spore maturation protein CgeB
MKLVIFGLSISSSWGNGHATLWRGLVRALIRRGHAVHFFERDVPYYANQRDLTEIPGGALYLYQSWEKIAPVARAELRDADVGMVTSYCPDALPASDLLLDSPSLLRVFYDLDTGVTLRRLEEGEPVEYIGPHGFRDYDLVLSYTGGKALSELRTRLGARVALPLYGSVDPEAHYPVPPIERFRADLSYLGTYAVDRQQVLTDLFIEPARRLPERRFCLGGAMYPREFPWTENIFFVRHLPPAEHCHFYCSSRITLNVTRAAMASMGYCPSGRLFEAAACGTPILTDYWEGLDPFFKPGSEILVARSTEDAVAALEMSDAELRRIAGAARDRTLAEHTAEARAIEMEQLFESARRPSPADAVSVEA